MNHEIEKTISKIHALFKARRLSLSVAESCTGGLISHYITSLSGASTFFTAGVVSYSENAKENILKVPGHILHTYGMVSEETAKKMSEQMRIITGSDYSVAATGNLGPDGLEGKDIGLIYIAVSKKGDTITTQLNLKGSREENKQEAALSALQLLIDVVGSHE